MRFRKFRKIGRANVCRVLGVITGCFIMGFLYGMNKREIGDVSNVIKPQSPDSRISERFEQGESVEVLGRKKLSLKSEKPPVTFSRLPHNFERNVFPPRAPASEFVLEPQSVLNRNRNPDSSHTHYFMLFLVKSSPVHNSRREIIRRTWGSVKTVDGLNFNTIFLIGKVGDNVPLQVKLDEENAIHGDILQSDAPEGYRNLPIKVLSAMQWLISNSPSLTSDFYTFTDDDCVIHISNVVDFFRPLTFEESNLTTEVSSTAPTRGHEISDIKLDSSDDAKKNEVSLPVIHSVKVEPGKDPFDSDFNPENNDGNAFPNIRPLTLYHESDLKFERAENDDVIMEDPNAKIQIQRTGREEDLDVFPEQEKGTSGSMEDTSVVTTRASDEYYNDFYAQQAKNLTSYLKQALNSIENPGKIFAKRRLVPDTIYCGYCYDMNAKPHRKLNTKWGMSMALYSPATYPAFCHGGMYTMTGTLMTSLFAISTVTDYEGFHLEDVLITGILREKSGVANSNFIRRGSDPKAKPLMYYAWDSGPRLMFKMSRKWRMFTKSLLGKHFLMESIINGKLLKWDNFGRQ